MKQKPEGSDTPGNNPDNPADSSIYGIRSNDAKHQALLGTANHKVVTEMQNIVKQVASLLQAAQQDPQGNLNKLLAAISILKRGQAIQEVTKVLTDFQPAKQGEVSFSGTTDIFEQLLQQARDMMRQQGLPQSLLEVNPPALYKPG